MIKRVMLLGVGAAVGWLGHTVFSRGRDEAVVRAEESLRTTFHPDTIGRNAGQAAATALAASARSFAQQLREEVPAWKTVSGSTIRVTVAEGPDPTAAAPSSHITTPTTPTTEPRKQS